MSIIDVEIMKRTDEREKKKTKRKPKKDKKEQGERKL